MYCTFRGYIPHKPQEARRTESCGTLLPLGRAWQMKFSRNREWTKLNTLSGLYLNEGGTQTTAMPRHKTLRLSAEEKKTVQQNHKVKARTFRYVMGSFWVSIWYQLNACARARGGVYMPICDDAAGRLSRKKSPKKCPTTTTDHIHASEQRSYSLRTSANEPDQKQYSESKLSRPKKKPNLACYWFAPRGGKGDISWMKGEGKIKTPRC